MLANIARIHGNSTEGGNGGVGEKVVEIDSDTVRCVHSHIFAS